MHISIALALLTASSVAEAATPVRQVSIRYCDSTSSTRIAACLPGYRESESDTLGTDIQPGIEALSSNVIGPRMAVLDAAHDQVRLHRWGTEIDPAPLDATLQGPKGSGFGAAIASGDKHYAIAAPGLDATYVIAHADLALGLSAATRIDGASGALAYADIDGDGAEDLVIAGSAGVFLAGSTGAPIIAGDVASLAVGDLDGDGIDDLVVGDPDGAGSVHLFLGGPWLTAGGLDLGDASASWQGERTGDGAGTSLAVGDLTGDGVDDLLVGAPYTDFGGTDAGTAYVVAGGAPTGGSLYYARAILDGPEAGASLGGDVAWAGDTDGDGVNEMLLGGGGCANGSLDGAGCAWLVPGKLSGFVSPEAGVRFTSDVAGARLGEAVAGGVDLDEDGRADLMLGGPAAVVGIDD